MAAMVVFAVFGGLACSGGQEGPRPAASGGEAGASGAPGVNGGSPNTTAGASTAGTPGMSGGSSPVVSGGSTGQGGAPVVGPSLGANVMTWVPPYHVAESRQQLSANFGGATMADGLSFLALQFWLTDGPATRLDQATEADVSWFHDWARQHGVKILLCVHNNTGDWNWPEAGRSFRDNRDAFVVHLLSEVQRRDFDGVDLDLEGIIEPTAEDAQGYRALVQALADGLHPQGKVLTMDSFHGQWNAPNWNWWPDLLPLVDGITSMGYEQSGLNVDYQELVDHAAVAPQKLMIGVPSYQGTWQGHSVTEHLDWLVQQGQVGTSIWDASLSALEWQQRGVWDQLKTIKTR